jgi:hypothetical protein
MLGAHFAAGQASERTRVASPWMSASSMSRLDMVSMSACHAGHLDQRVFEEFLQPLPVPDARLPPADWTWLE